MQVLKLAKEFTLRTGLVEMFQGHGTLDKESFDYKLTLLKREE